jgi:anti-sigma regulatory factor (Ser/Thr protein kinase)
MRVDKTLDRMLSDITVISRRELVTHHQDDGVLDIVRAALEDEISNMHERYQFDMVFYEALSNAIEHGNKNRPGSGATVNIYVGERGLVADIKDQGQGYDVEKKFADAAERLKRAIEGSEDSRRLGLYIFLMFPAVQINVQENGTRVLMQYMRKRISS